MLNSFAEILINYGALGCWVIFSIYHTNKRERHFENERLRWNAERMRWNTERMRWLRTLGKKMSDDTIDETMGRDE